MAAMSYTAFNLDRTLGPQRGRDDDFFWVRVIDNDHSPRQSRSQHQAAFLVDNLRCHDLCSFSSLGSLQTAPLGPGSRRSMSVVLIFPFFNKKTAFIPENAFRLDSCNPGEVSRNE
jgi:hypothetical protein